MTQTSTESQHQSITISAIEKELAALWKQPRAENQAVANPHVTRACVMTLIVPVSGQQAANQASAVVTQLTDRFPNRAIVIDIRPGAGDDRLDAWVQANCQMPATGRTQICGEQVSLEASGNGLDRVPATVLPLLVSDVPVVLWWPDGAPASSPLFSHLALLADRVLVDSSTFDAPEQQIADLVALSQRRYALSDLTWGRLTPWRELVAQFFDSPTSVGQLQEIQAVTLRYNQPSNRSNDRLQPLLLIGWLTTKLGWQIVRSTNPSDPAITVQRSDGGTVGLHLEASDAPEASEHTIQSLSLRCSHGTFSIARSSNDCAMATTELAGAPTVRRAVRLEARSRIDLLVEELRLFGRDKGYEGALRAAAALLGR